VDDLVVVDAFLGAVLGKMLLHQTQHQVAELKIDEKDFNLK
jgi:hypothetical protein